MKYKVGDKVKIIIFDSYCNSYKNEIGIITLTDRIKKGYSSRWDYEVQFNDGYVYPFSPEEVEKVPTKGQLLFPFMNE